MTDPGPHLFGMLPEELASHARDRGVALRDDEARRFLAQTISHPPGYIPRRPLSAKTLEKLTEITRNDDLEVVERAQDPDDQFVKYLFRSPDGALHEAVRIPLHIPGRFTVCLSSQVGCAMQCVFCATGRLGFTRHLESWEMVRAFTKVRDDAIAEGVGRPTGAVFMGQGEPLHNYDNVIRAARVLSDPCGGRVSGDAITISTVGLVPQIHRYAQERHPYRLIVSLTSAIAEKRKQLLPVAGNFTMDEICDAIRAYAAVSKGRFTIAWVLLSGINTGADEVEALRDRLGDLAARLRINLIDVNDATGRFAVASAYERKRFLEHLQILKAPIVRRYSGGKNKDAACGMLAAKAHAPR